ncbi:MAG: hypothetical protein H8E46_08210 [FCB group bacterium]|nr:hypothetical protein [FCB group bacterium]
MISGAFAQDYLFNYEPLGIPVEMQNGDVPASPWIGGIYKAAPTLADIDADGDYDLFSGGQFGGFWFFRN